MEAHESQHVNEDSCSLYFSCVLALLLYGSNTWTLTQLDRRRLDSFHTRCQRRILHRFFRWHDRISNDEVRWRTGLLAASSIPQTKTRIIWARCQTRWWCPSKPDPSDHWECQDGARLEACSRSTSHHLDSTDLPGHGNTGDRCTGVGGRKIVLAANRNGGMLRLNATRYDDDE